MVYRVFTSSIQDLLRVCKGFLRVYKVNKRLVKSGKWLILLGELRFAGGHCLRKVNKG